MLRTLVVLAAALPVAAAAVAAAQPDPTRLTLIQEAPSLDQLDLGPGGPSRGDLAVFRAPVRTEDGAEVGAVVGSKLTAHLLGASERPVDERLTTLVFRLGGSDSLVVQGVAEYPGGAGEFAPEQPVVRAVVGGTGGYLGARGQLTSTRNPDGSYTQLFELLD